ncbi:MAG: hypothetical protein GY853_06750, partial [PVC group bacterium]|nr:hypothetical protein [PVC group bacterium]
MRLTKIIPKKLPIILLVCICFCPLLHAQNNTNTCSIGNINALGGRSFGIDINLANEDTIAGFQMPFSFDFENIGITCDSIDFAGGRCANFDFLDVKIDNEAKEAYLTGISKAGIDTETSELMPGSGKIASIYFTVSQIDRDKNIRFLRSQFPDLERDFIFAFWNHRAE